MRPDSRNEKRLEPRRVNLLGVGISAINMEQALQVIEGSIAANTPQYFCVAPAHAVMDCYRRPELKRIFNASGLTTPDGMSIVWLLRLKGYSNTNRVYGPDLMLSLCKESIPKAYSHFFYGGEPGVASRLAGRLAERYPGLHISGTYSPPFRKLTQDEDEEIVNKINASSPDIVWVGLGTPKQELWMAAHLDRIRAPVLIGVGAAFDFLSGSKPQAPRWMQRAGLEWAFRLATEPDRLWPRYRQYPLFVMLVLAEALGLRKFGPVADHSTSVEEKDDEIEA